MSMCGRGAVQLSIDHDDANLGELLPQFTTMAEKDPSQIVRLYLASAMQRIPAGQRWEVVQKLSAHTGDVHDQNLPLMYWYAAEPPRRGRSIAGGSAFGLSCAKTIPLLRELTLRRIGGLEKNAGLAVLVSGLSKSTEDDERLAIVRALRAALAGQRRAKAACGLGRCLRSGWRKAAMLI